MTKNATKRNWEATQEFEVDSQNAQRILEAAAKAISDLRHDDQTRRGLRTREDVEAMGDALSHALMLCEALAALDGGKLARQVL